MARTTVSIYVRRKDQDRAIEALKSTSSYEIIADDDQDFDTFVFYEKLHGDIDEERFSLIEAGIPFDSYSEGCHEYNATTQSTRFLADGSVLTKIMNEDFIPYIEADKVLKALTENPNDIQVVIEMLNERIDHNTNPNWDDQDEFAKIFLSKSKAERSVREAY